MNEYYVLGGMVLLSGFIGWMTNYMAIKMIFHPKKELNFLIFKIQGLLPRRQEEIAVQVSETIEEEFFSSETLLKKIRKIDFEKDLEEFIDKVVDEKLSDIVDGIPLLGSFVTSGIISKVKIIFKEEIKGYKDKVVGDLAEQIKHSLDVKEMIYERISDYNIEKLEQIVKKIAKKELKHIELLGGILGMAIGLIQVSVIVFFNLLKQ